MPKPVKLILVNTLPPFPCENILLILFIFIGIQLQSLILENTFKSIGKFQIIKILSYYCNIVYTIIEVQIINQFKNQTLVNKAKPLDNRT